MTADVIFVIVLIVVSLGIVLRRPVILGGRLQRLRQIVRLGWTGRMTTSIRSKASSLTTSRGARLPSRILVALVRTRAGTGRES